MIFSYLLNMQSHPSWVCGLKHISPFVGSVDVESHPSWVCGLKQGTVHCYSEETVSHPSWVCGLKLFAIIFSAISL